MVVLAQNGEFLSYATIAFSERYHELRQFGLTVDVFWFVLGRCPVLVSAETLAVLVCFFFVVFLSPQKQT